jgi:hypothetical protein
MPRSQRKVGTFWTRHGVLMFGLIASLAVGYFITRLPT